MTGRIAPERFLDADKEPDQSLTPLEEYEHSPLVPLKEAVQPIRSLLYNCDAMVEVARRGCRKPADGLTQDESSAIHLYTMQWPESHPSLFQVLNKNLRSKNRSKLTPWFLFLKLFLTALYKLPSIRGLVYRGVKGDLSANYEDDYFWWGMSSCTETMDVMKTFIGTDGDRTIFNIECLHGKSIRSHSYFQEENEILLMPGSYFKVVSKWQASKGLFIIHLREQSPPYVTLISPTDVLAPSMETLTISTKKKNDSAGKTTSAKSCAGQNWLGLQFEDGPNERIRRPDEVEGIMNEPAGFIDPAILDRIRGSMIGMAIGDALGAHVEFRPHEYLAQHPVKDLGSGGTWGLEKGQFTDATSMALCLANSLIASRGFNPYDQLVRYKWWYELGYMSSTGRCFDIGAATRQSIAEFAHRQERFAHEHKIPLKDMDYLSDPELLRAFNFECSGDGVAGNGALMRLTPVPLFFYRNSRLAVEYSGYSGYITHGDRKAYDACRYYGALIVAALHGYAKDQLLDTGFYWKHREWFGTKELHPDIKSIAEGSYKKNRGYEDGIRGKGYIVNALEAALWAFWDDNNSFEKGALAAVNLGDDTDTTAAIYGQLAGALYGYDKLPPHWLEHVYARGFMEKLSKWIAYEGECWQKRSDEQTN